MLELIGHLELGLLIQFGNLFSLLGHVFLRVERPLSLNHGSAVLHRLQLDLSGDLLLDHVLLLQLGILSQEGVLLCLFGSFLDLSDSRLQLLALLLGFKHILISCFELLLEVLLKLSLFLRKLGVNLLLSLLQGRIARLLALNLGDTLLLDLTELLLKQLRRLVLCFASLDLLLFHQLLSSDLLLLGLPHVLDGKDSLLLGKGVLIVTEAVLLGSRKRIDTLKALGVALDRLRLVQLSNSVRVLKRFTQITDLLISMLEPLGKENGAARALARAAFRSTVYGLVVETGLAEALLWLVGPWVLTHEVRGSAVHSLTILSVARLGPPVEELVELPDLRASIVGKKSSEVDSTFALASGTTVSAFPWFLEGIADRDVVLVLVTLALVESSGCFEGLVARDADSLVEFGIPSQVPLGLDVGQVSHAEGVSSLVEANLLKVLSSVSAIEVSVPGGIASSICITHKLDSGLSQGWLRSSSHSRVLCLRSGGGVVTRLDSWLLLKFNVLCHSDSLLEERGVHQFAVDVVEHALVS